MKSLHVDLIESSDAWYLSVDSREHKELLYNKRTGLLQRNTDSERAGTAIELQSPGAARPLLASPVTAQSLTLRKNTFSFKPAKILRDNEPVLQCLRQLQPVEWRIVIRAIRTGRIIISRGDKAKKSYFTYYSLLVKLRLKDRRDYIEVGEGSVRDLKFNLDGLCSRLKKTVENHRQSKRMEFRDKVPVILNSGDGAIMFHELLGHCLEADYIYRKQSPITLNDIGQTIVSEHVNLVTRYAADTFFSGISCDDEGQTAASPVLVEKGVLRHLVSDSFYQEKLGLDQCGHCRSEDFTLPPMPRMYALYLQPGSFRQEELIASTKYGVYAGEFGDGKVLFHKNLFYFHIRDAHLIENGKLTAPLGSIIVQGNIFEALNSVAMIADDFRFDKGISYCFKNGQTLNVRVGQPSVKIENLYIAPYKGVD
jgi:predicted Zn-dependent protease